MKDLAKHELRHPDGRRVFVYGTLVVSARLGDAALDAHGIHKRFDQLTEEWVAISPSRNVRPLDSDGTATITRTCPICPGGIELPFAYDAAVIENRFPSFMKAPPIAGGDGHITESSGRCEVVVYTNRHDASFGSLSAEEAARVFAIWTDRSLELWGNPRHEYVLIFENRGAEAGATLAHPHGQIYAFDHLTPRQIAKAHAHSRHRAETGHCLSCMLVETAAEREIMSTNGFAVAVPFAPRWPYEVAIRARRHGVGRISDLSSSEQADLLNALREVALRLDYLFGREMPYLMVGQEAPHGQTDWHLAFEFYPLLRSKAATKIRASVETATGLFLNDVLPEDAAARLRDLRGGVDPSVRDQLMTVT